MNGEDGKNRGGGYILEINWTEWKWRENNDVLTFTQYREGEGVSILIHPLQPVLIFVQNIDTALLKLSPPACGKILVAKIRDYRPSIFFQWRPNQPPPYWFMAGTKRQMASVTLAYIKQKQHLIFMVRILGGWRCEYFQLPGLSTTQKNARNIRQFLVEGAHSVWRQNLDSTKHAKIIKKKTANRKYVLYNTHLHKFACKKPHMNKKGCVCVFFLHQPMRMRVLFDIWQRLI